MCSSLSCASKLTYQHPTFDVAVLATIPELEIPKSITAFPFDKPQHTKPSPRTPRPTSYKIGQLEFLDDHDDRDDERHSRVRSYCKQPKGRTAGAENKTSEMSIREYRLRVETKYGRVSCVSSQRFEGAFGNFGRFVGEKGFVS